MHRIWEVDNSGFIKLNLDAQTSAIRSVMSWLAWCKSSRRRDFLVHQQHTQECCLVTCLAEVTAWANQNFRDLTFSQTRLRIYTACLLTDVTHDLKTLGQAQPQISPFINTLIIQEEQNWWSVKIRSVCTVGWQAGKDRMWLLMKKDRSTSNSC